MGFKILKSRHDKLKENMDYILGHNPSSVGHIFEKGTLLLGYNNILRNNIQNLNRLKQSVQLLDRSIKEQECDIFEQSGRILRKQCSAFFQYKTDNVFKRAN